MTSTPATQNIDPAGVTSPAFTRRIDLTRESSFEKTTGPRGLHGWPASDFATRLAAVARSLGVAIPVIRTRRDDHDDVVTFDEHTHWALMRARLDGEFLSRPARGVAQCVEVPWIIKNATPHALSIVAEGDGEALSIPPSGFVARVAESTSEQHSDGLALITMGDVEGLPPIQDGVLWVVSKLTAIAALSAAPDRDDLVVVAGEVRDDAGRIIGARGLARIYAPQN